MHLDRWFYILGAFMMLYDTCSAAVQTHSLGRPLDWFSLAIELFLVVLRMLGSCTKPSGLQDLGLFEISQTVGKSM